MFLCNVHNAAAQSCGAFMRNRHLQMGFQWNGISQPKTPLQCSLKPLFCNPTTSLQLFHIKQKLSVFVLYLAVFILSFVNHAYTDLRILLAFFKAYATLKHWCIQIVQCFLLKIPGFSCKPAGSKTLPAMGSFASFFITWTSFKSHYKCSKYVYGFDCRCKITNVGI